MHAALFFEGRRYYLSAWCVMPNHVHALVTPLGDHTLSGILHSWKSYTANNINRLVHEGGPLWERESFNHLIRSAEHWQWFVDYTERNPVNAGLCSTPEEWPFSSCSVGFQPAPELSFVDSRKTPYVPLRGRGRLPHLCKDAGIYFVTFRLADAVGT